MLSVLIGLLIPASKRISSVSSNANAGDLMDLLCHPIENALQGIYVYCTPGNRALCLLCVYLCVMCHVQCPADGSSTNCK